jgi:hypothetical protein
MLAGNANIVRVSGKPSPQVDLIVATLNETMQRPEFERVARRVAIVRFEHNPETTRHLSSLADLRIIWGGDATINTIRAAPIAPLARDVAFPDRWSLAVLDAAAVLASPDMHFELARQFANDAYWFAQMACSSPRLIVWRGDPENARAAAALFFALLDEEAKRLSRFISPVDYVNKRIFEDEMAIRTHAAVRQGPTNLVSVVTVPKDEVTLRTQFCGGGAFISTQIDHLDHLSALLERRVQTVVSYGIAASEWTTYLAQPDVPGIDRVVPPGRALAFESVWDGMDLLREFTRETTISVT